MGGLLSRGKGDYELPKQRNQNKQNRNSLPNITMVHDRPKIQHRNSYSEGHKRRSNPNNERREPVVGCFGIVGQQRLEGRPQHRTGSSHQKYRNKISNDVKEALDRCRGISVDSKIKILGSLVPTLSEGPRRPAVFLILKPEGDSKNNDYLVNAIAEACNNVYNANRKFPKAVMTFSYKDFVEEYVKPTIAVIGKAMADEGRKVLVITDIDRVNTSPFFTFLHSYCDNDYAPFKNVAYFFSATIPSNLGSHSQSLDVIADELRNQIFNKAWCQLEEDVRKALLARIGASTIVIQSDTAIKL